MTKALVIHGHSAVGYPAAAGRDSAAFAVGRKLPLGYEPPLLLLLLTAHLLSTYLYSLSRSLLLSSIECRGYSVTAMHTCVLLLQRRPSIGQYNLRLCLLRRVHSEFTLRASGC